MKHPPRLLSPSQEYKSCVTTLRSAQYILYKVRKSCRRAEEELAQLPAKVEELRRSELSHLKGVRGWYKYIGYTWPNGPPDKKDNRLMRSTGKWHVSLSWLPTACYRIDVQRLQFARYCLHIIEKSLKQAEQELARLPARIELLKRSELAEEKLIRDQFGYIKQKWPNGPPGHEPGQPLGIRDAEIVARVQAFFKERPRGGVS